jgi:hypothetical protein
MTYVMIWGIYSDAVRLGTGPYSTVTYIVSQVENSNMDFKNMWASV